MQRVLEEILNEAKIPEEILYSAASFRVVLNEAKIPGDTLWCSNFYLD